MKIAKVPVILSVIAIAATSLYAMPPRQGIPSPKIVQDMQSDGIIDNPSQGLMLRFGRAKVSGTNTYPVVMGYFTDQASTYTQSQFQARLFSSTAGAKSVTNYYKDMSYNTMTCTGTVYPWASVGNTKYYFTYGAYGFSNTYPKNTPGFIFTLLNALDATVDFADPAFDVNNDYYVDVLWVVHSGMGAEETGSSSDIWSHSSQLDEWYDVTAYATNDYRNGNRIYINKYIIMPEVTALGDGNDAITEQIGCGVFCHEFGHALGLPDLYDTGAEAVAGSGLGNWSCMAGGSWGGDGVHNATPVSLDVWCKRFLGWASPVNITSNTTGTGIASILNTQTNSSYRIAKGGSAAETQYWLVENRYSGAAGPVGGIAWDAYLPASGLAIYHIDDAYTSSTYMNNNSVNRNSTNGTSKNRPLGVALEETDQTALNYQSELWDGTADAEGYPNSGDAQDVFNSTNQASFDSTGTAYPISYKNDNTTKTGICIKSISAAGASMTANFCITPGSTGTPALAVSMSSWSPAAAGVTSSAVNVTNSATAGVIAYTVSDNAAWLTTSATSGNTPGSFTMTATANTGAARSATVTVTATTSGVSGSPQTISVNQAAGTGGQNDAGTGGDAGGTFAAATMVSPGSWTDCYLDATDNEDYYKFNVTSGQKIKIRIAPPAPADFDLYLYNPSQISKGSSTLGDGLVDSVIYTADASGYWYCRACEYTGSGNYSLLIQLGIGGAWTDVIKTTQSAHPYANNYSYTWTITGPAAAAKMKVYFDSIKTETNFDTVFVLNGAGTVIQKWHGTYKGIWSSEVAGNVLKIKLKTDNSVTKYGFLSTKYSYYTVAALSPQLAQPKENVGTGELLARCSPNPVCDRTSIAYNLQRDGLACLRIYDITGRMVRTLVNGRQTAGSHAVAWNGTNQQEQRVASGVYFVRLDVDGTSMTRRITVMR